MILLWIFSEASRCTFLNNPKTGLKHVVENTYFFVTVNYCEILPTSGEIWINAVGTLKTCRDTLQLPSSVFIRNTTSLPSQGMVVFFF